MKQLIGILLVFFGLASCSKEEPPLYLELKNINELTLAEVRVQKTVIIDDPEIHFNQIGSQSGILPDAIDWLKSKATFGRRMGIYTFGTYFSACMDLNKLTDQDVVIDKQKKKCTLTLPPIQIKELGRDFEMKAEHERVSIYRSRLTPEEKAKAKDEASKILSGEINKNSKLRKELIQKAEEKAQAYFETLLANWGYMCDIKFREEQP